MRSLRLAAIGVAGLLAAAAVPVGAPVPVVASDNIELTATYPDVGAISTAFDPARPTMYVNTLTGLTTYDISDPANPTELGRLPLPHFENEGMDIGIREDGTRFVLIGIDIFAVGGSQTVTEDGSYLIVVDVTDPAAPAIVSELDTSTSTHTVQCVDEACSYAYTSGVYEDEWQIVDLSDPTAPVLLDGTFTSPIGGAHQWTPDAAGYLWGAGFDGAVAMNVDDPESPTVAASTDQRGVRGASSLNNFIIHNVERPNATAFEVDEETEVSGSPETASVEDGNVLLVTEEDYDNPVCDGSAGAGEGSFSTWYIPYVDADRYAQDNPNGQKGRGKIVPLDSWNTEILDSGQQTIAGALCSAHYFTTHQDGFVAQGWYQQGTRILDVRDPRDIKQVGYFFATVSETWHAYWVPQRDADGRIIEGEYLDMLYTNDTVRGIDVLSVDLPDTAPGETEDLTAPILPEWLALEPAATSAPSAGFGFLCRLPGTLNG